MLKKMNENKIKNLIYILGNPLSSVLLSEIFIPEKIVKPSRGLYDSPIQLSPGETLEVIEGLKETGILKSIFLSCNSKNVELSVLYEIHEGYKDSWSYSIEDLLFLGINENTSVGPYVTKAEQAVHPYLGTTEWVYSVHFPSSYPIISMYNGYIEVKVINPSSATSTAKIWIVHVERWKVKEEYVDLFRKLFR